jgi:hypothetical protein
MISFFIFFNPHTSNFAYKYFQIPKNVLQNTIPHGRENNSKFLYLKPNSYLNINKLYF